MYKVIWISQLTRQKPRPAAIEHWKGRHAELMRALPGVERYIQNLWVAPVDPAVPGPDRYDLHSECWFTDEAAYLAALASPQWQATVEDAEICFEQSALLGAVLEEQVTIDRAG
jgi:uncharacterized protein (TIGR02118 family)